MFSDILKSLRSQKGITQSELAKYLDVTQQAVGRWEKSITSPDYATLSKIASYFNVSVDYLLERDESRTYYHNSEVAQMANELKDNPGMRVLFDASRGLKKESIEEVVKFIEFQKAKERGDY